MAALGTLMTALGGAEAQTTCSDGSVTGAPRRWLQLEGATLLVGSLVAFSTTDHSWWLVPLVLFLPDLFAAGYVGRSRVGAHIYNIGHATPLPVLLAGWVGGTTIPFSWFSELSGSATLGWTGCSASA
jgi:hypothetical protein